MSTGTALALNNKPNCRVIQELMDSLLPEDAKQFYNTIIDARELPKDEYKQGSLLYSTLTKPTEQAYQQFADMLTDAFVHGYAKLGVISVCVEMEIEEANGDTRWVLLAFPVTKA